MATNLYINNYSASNEQELINDITRESIQFYGIDVFYAPRTLIKEDKLFGEDVLSAFNDAYSIEMYINSTESFGGAGDIIQKFGLEIKDELELVVHKDRFKLVTGLAFPREGDLIYFPLSKGLFEIKFVEDEDPFYEHGSLYQFKLTCELFQYSQEDLQTGITEIDSVETDKENLDDSSVDPFSENVDIQTESDTIVDFSEKDPFSEGGKY